MGRGLALFVVVVTSSVVWKQNSRRTYLEVVEEEVVVCQTEDEFLHAQTKRHGRRCVLHQHNQTIL